MTISNPFSVQSRIKELSSKANMPLAEMSFGDLSHVLIELSILAYFDPEGAVKWGTEIGFTRTTQLNIDDNLSVSIFSNSTDIVVSFRGSYNVQNFVEDVEFKLVSDGKLPGKVHDGFLSDFNKLWDAIVPVLDTTKQLWVTGHSLGGALAAIAAVRASRRVGPNVNGLMTFGQPRIGNLDYVSKLYTTSNRYVNNADIVPHLPTIKMGFIHFGEEHYINSTGIVINNKSIWSRLWQFKDRVINTLQFGLHDHDVLLYRDAIIRTLNQERANGKR
jgi:hypothetical protein